MQSLDLSFDDGEFAWAVVLFPAENQSLAVKSRGRKGFGPGHSVFDEGGGVEEGCTHPTLLLISSSVLIPFSAA